MDRARRVVRPLIVALVASGIGVAEYEAFRVGTRLPTSVPGRLLVWLTIILSSQACGWSAAWITKRTTKRSRERDD